jgi:hypothetical protein
VEALMLHAIQIRQTGGPEVLNWTPIRRLARELKADWDGVLGHKMRVENG